MRPRSASAARTREALRDAVQIYAPSTVYAVGLGAMTPALAVAALALGLVAALPPALLVWGILRGLPTRTVGDWPFLAHSRA